MFQKNDHTPIEGVTLNDFWLVTNMMTFDNVGFSKAVSFAKFVHYFFFFVYALKSTKFD